MISSRRQNTETETDRDITGTVEAFSTPPERYAERRIQEFVERACPQGGILALKPIS